jgi:guanosine-3',5'-bis(diphosphate) 3'-pyrophosphohydrolase
MRAADAGARWHVHQRRKGSAHEPYNRLLEVASLAMQATDGAEPNVVIAALSYDVVEDQGITAEMIAKEFGKRVADIVMEVTDDKLLPKAERKCLQIENAAKKSRETKRIKLADKISNARAVTISPAVGWPVQRRFDYIEWA